MIDLYTWDTPNGRKITVALEEMGLPYTIHPIDITQGAQFDPAFLAISPNNRIPAIVDGDQSVFESGAILIYLAEKTGQFLPASGPARIAVMEWLMWQMGGFGPMPGQVHHFLGVDDAGAQAYGLKRYGDETRRLYKVLDTQLTGRDFVAGDLSIADFAIVGWAWRHEKHKVDLAEFPNVARWYAAMMARPATAKGFEVRLKH
jgi:GST-like protein